MNELHPISKLLLVLSSIQGFLYLYAVQPILCLTANITVLLLLSFKEHRKVAINSIYLLSIALITLTFLYLVDIRHSKILVDNIGTVVRYLCRISIFLTSFSISYNLLDREEVYYLLSKVLPTKAAVTLISIFYFLEVSKNNFITNLAYQKLKLGNNWGSFRYRLKLLPILVRNLFLSLFQDLQYYAISYHNKGIAYTDCSPPDHFRKFKFSRKDFLVIVAYFLYSLLISFHFPQVGS